MPIYEYVCNLCGHDLEIIQGFREPPLTHCPACGEIGLRKKVSAAAFHLKGTGWYETDFKNKAGKSDRNSEKTKPDNTETKAEKSSQSSQASSESKG